MTCYSFNWLARVAWDRSPLEWGLVFTNLYIPIMLWALTSTYLWVLRLNVLEPRRMIEACAVVLLVFCATTKLVNEPYRVWVLPLLLLISQYDSRLQWPLMFVAVIPILFLAINVPWPHLFRPFLTDTSIGKDLLAPSSDTFGCSYRVPHSRLHV